MLEFKSKHDLSSTIRFITENLYHDNLKEINSNLDNRFKNQRKIIKQVKKYTFFANYITKKNINTSLEAINHFNNKDEIMRFM